MPLRRLSTFRDENGLPPLSLSLSHEHNLLLPFQLLIPKKYRDNFRNSRTFKISQIIDRIPTPTNIEGLCAYVTCHFSIFILRSFVRLDRVTIVRVILTVGSFSTRFAIDRSCYER